MKLAVSNILWGNVDPTPYLELIAMNGCHGVELAPSVFWKEPVDASKEERNKVRCLIEGYGLKIVSLHALLYTRPDLTIFQDNGLRERTKDYLYQLGCLSRDMGCPLMVLGSPRNRARGELADSEADKIAIEFFSSLSEKLSATGVVLCIEPLSKLEADFITKTSEGLRLVNAVNHPNFRLMFDAKSLHLEQENYRQAVKKCFGYLEHVHVNDPGNSPLESKGVDHRAFGEALKYYGYDGVVSLEVGRGFGDPIDVIRFCLEKMRKYYA